MGSYFGHYYMKWSGAVGQTQFQKIKYEGDYLQYYFKDHDTGELLNHDCLNMNGFWWCQVTIPKIMKGQYSLSGNLWNGQLDYAVFVDGVKTAQIPSTNSGRPKWGDFNWTKTEEHTIKIVAVTWGMMFWDTVELTPIK